MGRHHFLCCFPLRVGVLLISLFQFLVNGAAGGFIWWFLWYIHEHTDIAAAQLTPTVRNSIIAAGVVYTIAAILGFMGFIGAIAKKNGFIRTFLFMLSVILGFNIVAGVYFLVTFYRTKGQSLEDCIGGSTDQVKIANCQGLDSYKSIPQAAVIVSVVLPILSQAYGVLIVYQYSRELQSDKYDRSSMAFKSNTHAAYHPVKPSEETYPLTHPNTVYPYSDTSQSFGNQTHHHHTPSGVHHAPVIHHHAPPV